MTESLLPVTALREQIFRRLSSVEILPSGLILGAFIPLKMQGRLCEACFAVGNRPDQKGCVTRPGAWLTIDSATGKLLFFSMCAAHDFVDPALYPLDSKVKIAGDPALRPQEAGARLLTSYCEVRQFVFCQSCDDGQRQSIQNLLVSLESALQSELMPYYRALSPEFFRWLEKMK